MIVFCLVLFTLTEALMGWVWVLCACAIVIAYLRIRKNLPNVKNLTLNLLAIFCMVLLIFLSGDFGLMSTMVNLLVVAACLKLINLHTRADYHMVLIILFFLIACGFIYHQSIYIVAYYFACLVVLFVTAFLLNRGTLSLPQSVTQSCKMMLQALPIAIALFMVVPRLPPFWQAPAEKNTQTGLSEQITPGDIANLAQSDELVFRAEFEEAIPSAQERYWRSIVLDYFDGKSWMMGRQHTGHDRKQLGDKASLLAQSTRNYRYLVIAEPNDTRWLYSLDVPIVEENMSAMMIGLNQQYQLYQSEINKSPSLYILHSFTDIKLNAFVPEIDFARYLQLPLEGNPRTQSWVNENITDAMDFNEKVKTLNGFFTQNPFAYTLKPPLMPNSPVDSFLFDHQQGFCSHYASALTYMLRLSNVPARMVAGYQGGTEQGDDILSVRQFDAHAWVEAYDTEQGWVRLDPTALVAPNRVLSGLLSALNAQDSAVFSDEISGIFDIPFLTGFAESFAVLDHKWNQLVLGFNNDSQTDLVERLFGELSRKNLITLLLITLVAIAMFLTVLFVPYQRIFKINKKSSLEKLLRLLSKAGLVKEPHETLEQFYQRISPLLSKQMNERLERFISAFYDYSYGNDSRVSEKELDVLYTAVAAVKKPIAKIN
jgi:transglutaminase-like putative cysteine protease